MSLKVSLIEEDSQLVRQIHSIIKVTPVITAGAYSANDIVGGNLTISNAGRRPAVGGLIKTLTVIDKAKQNAELNFLFFSALAGTYLDNAAEAISVADGLSCLGIDSILATDYKNMANFSIASIFVGLEGIPFSVVTRDLKLLVRTPGTPTYVSTSDLLFVFGVVRN